MQGYSALKTSPRGLLLGEIILIGKLDLDLTLSIGVLGIVNDSAVDLARGGVSLEVVDGDLGGVLRLEGDEEVGELIAVDRNARVGAIILYHKLAVNVDVEAAARHRVKNGDVASFIRKGCNVLLAISCVNLVALEVEYVCGCAAAVQTHLTVERSRLERYTEGNDKVAEDECLIAELLFSIAKSECFFVE